MDWMSPIVHALSDEKGRSKGLTETTSNEICRSAEHAAPFPSVVVMLASWLCRPMVLATCGTAFGFARLGASMSAFPPPREV